MGVPKHFEMHKPFLECVKDGKVYTLKNVCSYIIKYFNLTQEDLKELVPSGRQSKFENRVSWAGTYLKKAGLINSLSRANYVITNDGLNVLKENPDVINSKYLMRFESFRNFQNISTLKYKEDKILGENEKTPDEIFEESFKQINSSLADDLLSEVMKLSSGAFEQMVIDLLYKMGYGAFENSGKTTSLSRDGGIDGIIMEDKLGFNLIYIQAKKWDLKNTISRPNIQSFVGAISGKKGKGLFVTTPKFSDEAIKYANEQYIILINGEKLTKFMIEYNFGVNVKKVFEIKAIDLNIFEEYI